MKEDNNNNNSNVYIVLSMYQNCCEHILFIVTQLILACISLNIQKFSLLHPRLIHLCIHYQNDVRFSFLSNLVWITGDG